MNDGTVFQPRGSAEIAPGLRLNETYEIVGFVGEGGLSQVYRAFNIRNRHPVAIKFLRADLIGDADTMELFNREASILAELSHDAIVKYLGFSFDPMIRREYLVMEFVEGVSLETRMRERALSAAEALTLKTRIAGGLSAAHRRGAVHRDMSPDNVILPGGDIENAKIIDFGIAKALKFSANTVIGTGLAGKFSYMSPEQVFGGEVTEKSDVYSLGLVLAAALRGVPLDMGKTLAELGPKRATAPELVGVDPILQPLIAKMLRPNPAERPGMDDVASWRPETAQPAPAKPAASASRVGGIAALAGAFVIGASLVATGYVFRDDLGNMLRRGQPAPSGTEQASDAKPDAGQQSPLAEVKPTAETAPTPIAPETQATPDVQPTPAVVSSPVATAESPAPSPSPEVRATPIAPPPPSAASEVPAASPTPAATTVAALPPPQPPKAPSALMTLDIAYVGRPFRQALPAFESGDPDGLHVSMQGALPEGLELKDAGRGVAVVEGTPSQGGAMPFTVVATDRNNRAASMRAIAIVAERRVAASPSASPRAAPIRNMTTPSPLPRGTMPAPVATSAAQPAPAASMSVAGTPSPTSTADSPVTDPTQVSLAGGVRNLPAELQSYGSAMDLSALLLRYSSGDCWLTRTFKSQGDSPRIEAVSGDASRLAQFAQDLSRQVGPAPVLTQVAIDRSQCPVLAFFRSAGPFVPSGLAEYVALTAPRLELASRSVGGVVPLAGTVRGLAGRTLTLLVVRDNGRTASLKVSQESADSAHFTLDITKVDDEDVGRKLAVAAIVSSRPLTSLREAGANQPRALVSLGSAGDLFPKLAPEAVEAGAWTDVEFVTLARP